MKKLVYSEENSLKSLRLGKDNLFSRIREWDEKELTKNTYLKAWWIKKRCKKGKINKKENKERKGRIEKGGKRKRDVRKKKMERKTQEIDR